MLHEGFIGESTIVSPNSSLAEWSTRGVVVGKLVDQRHGANVENADHKLIQNSSQYQTDTIMRSWQQN